MADAVNTTRRMALKALSLGAIALGAPAGLAALHIATPSPPSAYAGDGWYLADCPAWPGRVHVSRYPRLDEPGHRYFQVTHDGGAKPYRCFVSELVLETTLLTKDTNQGARA